MSNSTIKIVAILSMLIDHIGAVFMADSDLYLVFRSIGRLAFPIFAYFIAEGCQKTRNIQGYLRRLLLFGLISEIPFDLAGRGMILEFGHQNVFFTLFLGALAIYFYKSMTEKEGKNKTLGWATVACLAFLAELFNTDYGALGVMLIFILYYKRGEFKSQALAILLMNILFFNPLQLWGCLSVIPLYFYNQTRGMNLKVVFYAFYPLHLLILGLIAKL